MVFPCLRLQTKRSSGPGGQHVNTTDSAVRVTHTPTGLTATASTRSQHRNRVLAMDMLRAKLGTYVDAMACRCLLPPHHAFAAVC